MEGSNSADLKGSNPSLYSTPPPPQGTSTKLAHHDTTRALPNSTILLQQTQSQLDDVVDIMRVNVDKVLERGQTLPTDLDSSLEALDDATKQWGRTPRPPSENSRSIGSYVIKALEVVTVIIATPVIVLGTSIACSAGLAAFAAIQSHKALTEKNVNYICAGIAAFGAGVLGAIGGLVAGPFIAIIVECITIKDIISETSTLRQLIMQKMAEKFNQTADTPNTSDHT